MLWSLISAGLTLAFWPAIVATIAFTLLAVREARRSSKSSRVRAVLWALAPLLTLITASMVFLLWTATPGILAAAKSKQELAVLNSLKAVRIALGVYQQRFGGFPATLTDLERNQLIKSGWDRNITGYYFSYNPGKRTGATTFDSFFIVAQPRRFSFGHRWFFLDERGEIWIQASENAKEIEEKLPPPPGWALPQKTQDSK